jgi:2-dehydro-3-deoxyphosphogluconate aldolase / (4S)-4-hydroxy-2-oxoglutarate aldolase
MAHYSRLEVLNRLVELGLVPVFYHPEPEIACRTAAACAAGGASVVEFVNRGDHAIDVFKAMVQFGRQEAPGLMLGAGSIVDAPTAALYVAHGANFIVGPSFDPEVARFCNRRKIAYLPGCLTPTEIATAEEAGVEIVKVFPSESVKGPEFVRHVLGPCPWSRIMPTGLHAVTPETVKPWFDAGAVALGVGQQLVRKEFVERRDYAALQNRAAEILAWVRAARTK